MNYEKKYTPAPWAVEKNDKYITGEITSPLHTYSGNPKVIDNNIIGQYTMTSSDAYLIASSPDLMDLHISEITDINYLIEALKRDEISNDEVMILLNNILIEKKNVVNKGLDIK